MISPPQSTFHFEKNAHLNALVLFDEGGKIPLQDDLENAFAALNRQFGEGFINGYSRLLMQATDSTIHEINVNVSDGQCKTSALKADDGSGASITAIEQLYENNG